MWVQYRDRLQKDFDRFVDMEIISASQAEEMLAQVPVERRMLSIFHILIIFAALLACAALLSFIAANWDAIPRLARVTLVLLTTWGGYLTGAFFLHRGPVIVGQGLVLLAVGSFGAGIALVGQMYHLTGDYGSATLLWTSGAVIAAVTLRAASASAALPVLAVIYLIVVADDDHSWHNIHYLWTMPLILIASMVLALWVRSRITAHLTAIASMIFGLYLPYYFNTTGLMWVIVLIGAAKFASAIFMREKVERWMGFAAEHHFYTAMMTLTALFILQIDPYDNQIFSEIALGFLLLGFIVCVLVWAGQYAAVRWLAYGAFGFEVLYLYVETIGSILGTAGFFLLLALFVLLLAGLIYYAEKRMTGLFKNWRVEA